MMAEPYSEEWTALMHEIFKGKIGEGSLVMTPLTAARIAANTQIISNNHDPYNRDVISCKPVVIRKGAWVGAGSSILPGVTIGKYAIVGAASVVTKDVPDYAVAIGNPSRIIKYLNKDKFNE